MLPCFDKQVSWGADLTCVVLCPLQIRDRLLPLLASVRGHTVCSIRSTSEEVDAVLHGAREQLDHIISSSVTTLQNAELFSVQTVAQELKVRHDVHSVMLHLVLLDDASSTSWSGLGCVYVLRVLFTLWC